MRSRPRILAVDDDAMNLAVMEEMLAEDYNLQMANGGGRVVEIALRFRPDLVLLDIMMPDVNGYEVCRRLRSQPGLRHCKIILVSAKAMASERIAGYEAGADDYITKPFVIDEFMAKVRVYLRLKSVEEVDDLKTGFLNLLTHETRTPLTNILAPAELLISTDLPEKARHDFATSILANAHRLKVLLERVTLLSDLQHGETELQMEPVNVASLMHAASREIMECHSSTGLTVRVAAPDSAAVLAHPELLKEVITSVLDNAARVTPDGDTIEATVDWNAGQWVLSFRDHGPGIAPELLPHIFDGFRVGDIDHHSSGHGLSLAIAHSLLVKMDGSIDAVSEPGQGACFTITFPAWTEAAAA